MARVYDQLSVPTFFERVKATDAMECGTREWLYYSAPLGSFGAVRDDMVPLNYLHVFETKSGGTGDQVWIGS